MISENITLERDIPQFSNLTSTTRILCFKFKSRLERVFVVVSEEWKSFFCALSHTREQSQKKTSHIVYSKLIIIFFSCASQNICKEENSWKQQPQFGAKICVNICPWTLSFPRNPQFSLNFYFRETVRFLKQVMSTSKYVYILSCQIEALVYIISLRKLNTMF